MPSESANNCDHEFIMFEPPDSDGWQREACSWCNATLDWHQEVGL